MARQSLAEVKAAKNGDKENADAAEEGESTWLGTISKNPLWMGLLAVLVALTFVAGVVAFRSPGPGDDSLLSPPNSDKKRKDSENPSSPSEKNQEIKHSRE